MAVTQRLTKTFLEFTKSQQFGGVLLIACTLVSLMLANSDGGSSYISFWSTHFHIGSLELMSPAHFINDVLMSIFFLLVGLEIKREFIAGELSSFQKASLPVAAALGGMIVPALIYVFFNSTSEAGRGWGIPMATDIAFALGVLSLAGNRVPVSLKILLTALAVADDIGAVLVIAVFYSSGLQAFYLLVAAFVCVLLFILNKKNIHSPFIYIFLGVLLWYCIYSSGIHAAVAGVLLSLFIPFHKNDERKNMLGRWEHVLHAPVNYYVMPLFALANTAILMEENFSEMMYESVSKGVIAGLVIGKPLGICLFIFLAIKTKISTLPEGSGFRQLLGISCLGGIGFTMSIFISLLAFSDAHHIMLAKISVLVASLLSAVLGLVLLMSLKSSVEQKSA